MKMEWKDCRRLVVSGLLLYLAIHYWSVLADLAEICVGASAPLILGFVLAYMVNIPLTFFERKLKLEQRFPKLGAGAKPLYVLLTLALATVFVGSMLAYREKQLKRRLAYSTVSQVSYVLFGLMLLTPDGVQASLLQMVFHALAKDTLFLAAGAIIFSTNCTRVDQLRGIGRRMPVTMWCFTLAALSLIGIPPMAGFVSKWYLLTASLEAPIQAFGVAGLVVLVVSALLTAGYLLPVVTEGFFPGRDFITERREVGVQMTWPMIAFAAAVVLMGLLPGGLLHWLGLLAARLFP